jgi:hypothetical protein
VNYNPFHELPYGSWTRKTPTVGVFVAFVHTGVSFFAFIVSFFNISFLNIVLIITTYSHNCPPSNYQLTSHGVCFRTEVAACIKYMTRTDWQNHILGISTRGVDAMRTNVIIRGWVATYLQEADGMIALLEKMRTARERNTHMDGKLVGNENGGITDNGRLLEILLIRWYQIRKLCEDVVQALGE